MTIIKYPCGCKVNRDGINICIVHFVMFEDKLTEKRKDDITVYKYKYANGLGWKDISQELYNQIIHCINIENKDWIKSR